MSVVDEVVPFEVDDYDGVFVSVVLTFYSDDPFAVHMTFHGPNIVHWVIGRELLADGLISDSGIGDVQVKPANSGWDVEVELRTNHDYARFLAPAEALSDFLERTYEVCPAGAESAGFDVDAELHELLDMEGS